MTPQEIKEAIGLMWANGRFDHPKGRDAPPRSSIARYEEWRYRSIRNFMRELDKEIEEAATIQALDRAREAEYQTLFPTPPDPSPDNPVVR